MKDLVQYSLDKLSQYNSLHVLVDYAEPETKILYDAYCLHIEGLNIFTPNNIQPAPCVDPRVSLIHEMINFNDIIFYVGETANRLIFASFDDFIGKSVIDQCHIAPFEVYQGEIHLNNDKLTRSLVVPSSAAKSILSVQNDHLLDMILDGSIAFSLGFDLVKTYYKYGRLSSDVISKNLNDGLMFFYGHDGIDAYAYSSSMASLNQLMSCIDNIMMRPEMQEWYLKNLHHLYWSQCEQCLLIREI